MWCWWQESGQPANNHGIHMSLNEVDPRPKSISEHANNLLDILEVPFLLLTMAQPIQCEGGSHRVLVAPERPANCHGIHLWLTKVDPLMISPNQYLNMPTIHWISLKYLSSNGTTHIV
jgi:hypothetical protein